MIKENKTVRTSPVKKNPTDGNTERKKTANTGTGNRKNFGRNSQRNSENHSPKTSEVKVPPIGKETIRVIPLGGAEEVGQNMIIVEYEDDILIFDCGFQFVSEENPGIDYIIPNTKYLEANKHKIRALILTHGHLDHIAAIPYIIDKIGNPPIYARNLTAIMVQKRAEEFPNLPKPDLRIVNPKEKLKFGNLHVKFIEVTHSIPDSMGVSVETPFGNVVITGDLKLEHENGIPSEKEERNWGEIGKDNNILLIADSTNVEKPGFSIPEKQIMDNLENIIKNVNGRIIIGTFASQFERMIQIIQIAEKYNKKVITEGRSIKTNIEIAKLAGLLNPKQDTLVQPKDIGNYPPDRILVLATGAQGEEFAALMRMAQKKNKFIQLNKRDTIILSSSVVPGNELSVRKLKDNLYRHDVKIISYQVSDVHATGHGNAGELAWINTMVNARFFVPGYGHHSMLKVHAELARSIGMKDENIVVPDNGSVIEIRDKGTKIEVLKQKAPSNIVMVDGFSVGDIQEVVIRDRQTLAQDGIFVVIATIDLGTGKLRKSPDIISRGFVYLRESQDLLSQARKIVKKTAEDNAVGMKPINFELIKKELSDGIGRFLLKKTNKRPIIIPVVLGV
ncbi:TPA: hypothetical protein DCZ46_04170 [Candidatus Campbellbacteria bacterium]|nr:MAG: ribonuclease j1, ribonuclease J [Candidatus Campbellbacteria bacterium GW2011_OD1_34_28]KKP75033.1 MAG: RNA-metabolising metallo-beta-lactamase [Candidatus Campbellbacteria bacterium GW2011_GWD2_35_24]KKP75919.1 MAG: ribonuclease j1, ribonuclease J [Candidatus Campbellbacteria bacterium GW2011_GWC2_35_28]KKP76833.1 MAG: RNA-metabolising metallo-beta-lactamase [Candidatus Campbellbacteria bacterium GW2011_GWC1_35_31]KKP78759.1 MAG: RNA-metabolising metallo-beta-lactamase [Candidatus Camp